MRSVVAFALVAAGAACQHDVDMYPIGVGTGGPGGGGGTTPDAAAMYDAPANQPTQVDGRVCLVDDPRSPTICRNTGAGGLTVTLGLATTTTAADGSFTILSPGGTGLVWHVTGTAIVPSAMQLSTVHTIPALDVLLYEEMVATNNAVAGNGSGAIIARFTAGSADMSGLVASTAPDPSGLIYYDGSDAASFDMTSTGPFGVVWVPGLAPGPVALTLTGAHAATLDGIPVFADTITFVLAAI